VRVGDDGKQWWYGVVDGGERASEPSMLTRNDKIPTGRYSTESTDRHRTVGRGTSKVGTGGSLGTVGTEGTAGEVRYVRYVR
jgi:hypothetical protein